MRNNSFLLLLLIMTTFQSCLKTTLDSRIHNAVTELTNKYPQLNRKDKSQATNFKHIRTIIHGDNEFQVQLWSEPDSINDPQQIIVLVNSRNECVAIPFFSNTYRDYWEFPNEPTIPKVLKTNTTFTKEFNSALTRLNLNDSLRTGDKVIGELFFSILNCTNITEKDSAEILTGYVNSNKNLDNELFKKETKQRFRRNYEEISKDWKNDKYVKTYNSIFDKHNYRIYQFINKEDYYPKPLKLTIKSYRENAIFNTVSY